MKRFVRPLLATLYVAQLALVPAMGDPTPAAVAPPPAAANNKPTPTPSLMKVSADGDQVTLEFSQLMPYDIFTLTSPLRLVVEIPATLYNAGFSKKPVDSNLIRSVRGYQFKENPLIARVVVDLRVPVDYKTNTSGNSVILALKENQILTQKEGAEPKTRTSAKTSVVDHRDLLASLPKDEVTLDFEAADIRDVIRLMSETSGINIIFGSEVGGTISVHLRKVPFDEAFQTILNLKGLVASQLGANILRVTTPDLLERERTKAVVYTKAIPINYLKADDVMKHLLTIMNSSGRKGTITVVSQNNNLVLTDSAEGIQAAERLIAQIDRKPKQVMIEARIVEINLNNGFDMGVQWELANDNVQQNAAGLTQSDQFVGIIDRGGGARVSHQDAFTGNVNGVTGQPALVGADSPAKSGTGVNLAGPLSAGITFGFVKNFSAFSATLSALVTQSRAKILSAPKVVTINGQTARIEAVQDIRFRTSTVTGTGVVSNSFETVKAGIILSVVPTINAEDSITLVINPESSFPTQSSTEAGPIIRTRTAQTTVMIKDGDTLVIGGLIDDQDTKGVTKIPILGDIPILGAFFRSVTNSKIRNELLVFVTPRIVRE